MHAMTEAEIDSLAYKMADAIYGKLKDTFNEPKNGLVYYTGPGRVVVPPGLATSVPAFVCGYVKDIILGELKLKIVVSG